MGGADVASVILLGIDERVYYKSGIRGHMWLCGNDLIFSLIGIIITFRTRLDSDLFFSDFGEDKQSGTNDHECPRMSLTLPPI